MRTTLTIDDDLPAAARSLARDRSESLGRAVFELIRRGLDATPRVRKRQAGADFPALAVPRGSRPITAEDVMRRYGIILTVVVLGWLNLNASAEEAKLPVVIVTGQPNAYRLGAITGRMKKNPGSSPLLYYCKNLECTNPTNLTVDLRTMDAGTAGGMGGGIARSLAKHFPGGFAVVQYAACGAGLAADWKPAEDDGYYALYMKPFVAESFEAFRESTGREPEVRGIICHYGEACAATDEGAAEFPSQLKDMIDTLHFTYGRVPIVLGEIREFEDREGTRKINSHMRAVADTNPLVAVVGLQDVDWLPDGNVRLSYKGANEAGQRMVKAWEEMRVKNQ